jgi:hypothetical protein
MKQSGGEKFLVVRRVLENLIEKLERMEEGILLGMLASVELDLFEGSSEVFDDFEAIAERGESREFPFDRSMAIEHLVQLVAVESVLIGERRGDDQLDDVFSRNEEDSPAIESRGGLGGVDEDGPWVVSGEMFEDRTDLVCLQPKGGLQSCVGDPLNEWADQPHLPGPKRPDEPKCLQGHLSRINDGVGVFREFLDPLEGVADFPGGGEVVGGEPHPENPGGPPFRVGEVVFFSLG